MSYLQMLQTPVWLQENFFFLEDSATADNSLHCLEIIFGGRIISRGLWPLHLPDLNTMIFYLYSTLNDQLYSGNPHNKDDLRESIQDAGCSISSPNFSVHCTCLWDLRFSHWCCWKFSCFWKLPCVVWYVVLVVLKEHSASTYKGHTVQKEFFLAFLNQWHIITNPKTWILNKMFITCDTSVSWTLPAT